MGARLRTRRRRPGSTILGLALSFCVLVATLVFAAPEAEARYASIIVDAETGEVLRSRNADTRRYPASLTKMMTLYLLFEAVDNGRLSLESKLKVSKRAARQPASKLWLSAGSTIRVENAIRALIVKSANDVAVVVAEALGGTEAGFAEQMTRKANALGMSRTTFRNASGLPNRRQRSTARDMARLARALMQDFPHRYHYFDDQRFRYGSRTHRTPNRLLGDYRGLDGMKTGYIRASGFNLVSSAERDGRRIIAVVFGGRTARSRNSHMVNLLDLGFDRLAALDAERGRVRYAGIPRPPASSALAAPTPRFRPATVRLAAAAPSPPVEVAAAPPLDDVGAAAAAPAESVAVLLPAPSPPRVSQTPRQEPAAIESAALRALSRLLPLPREKPAPAYGASAGAHTPPQPRVASHATDRPWGIQVGAYASVTAAEIAMRLASVRAPLLNGAEAMLAPRTAGRDTLYRARFLGLYKNEANRVCKTLRAAPMPCEIIRGLDPAFDPAVSARS